LNGSNDKGLVSVIKYHSTSVFEVEEEGPGDEIAFKRVWVRKVVHEDGWLEETVLHRSQFTFTIKVFEILSDEVFVLVTWDAAVVCDAPLARCKA
jgi:hypothetical protein